ncbi:hypothetical protein MRX96_049471 [Rhipicephalus microplus]
MDPVMEAGPTTVSASCRETLVRRDVTEEPSSPSSASASCTGSDDPTCFASNSSILRAKILFWRLSSPICCCRAVSVGEGEEEGPETAPPQQLTCAWTGCQGWEVLDQDRRLRRGPRLYIGGVPGVGLLEFWLIRLGGLVLSWGQSWESEPHNRELQSCGHRRRGGSSEYTGVPWGRRE